MMLFNRKIVTVALPLLVQVSAVPNPQGYYPGGPGGPVPERLAAIANAFRTGFEGYERYAWNYDELLPVNNSHQNSFGGWGATAIDALDTAIIMNMPDIVERILDRVPSIDWRHPAADVQEISLFETTIRYIGGLLSAYDLLKGPAAYLAPKDPQKVQILLEQAQNLANNLSFAFDTPTGIPHNNLYPSNQSTAGDPTNGLATIGSLVLEWTHLSDLTGDPKYGELAQKGESYLLNPQPPSSQPWPGLLGTNVEIATGLFQDAAGGWQGGDDSFYEYLIKMYGYDNTRFGQYKDRWVLAADSTIAHLTSHPQPRPDLTFLAEFNGTQLILQSEHLACFAGGNFILGGLLLQEQKYITYGLALTAGCEDTYNQTVTGIGPDSFGWDPTQVPANQSAFFQRAGYYIQSGAYILRPEVLESFYYAWRATGDETYRDWSWNGIQAIISNCRVGSGFSELLNVNEPHGGGYNNFQDSFFFAEVLKYAYITQLGNEPYQVTNSQVQPWIFNTEAHPFPAAKVL